MSPRLAFISLASLTLAMLAFAAPALAKPVIVECKVSRSISGALTKIYSPAERAEAGPRERFALDVPAGKGCLIIDGVCDAKIGRLAVEQDEANITGRGLDAPVYLAYQPARQSYVLSIGDDSRTSERDECSVISLELKIP